MLYRLAIAAGAVILALAIFRIRPLPKRNSMRCSNMRPQGFIYRLAKRLVLVPIPHGAPQEANCRTTPSLSAQSPKLTST